MSVAHDFSSLFPDEGFPLVTILLCRGHFLKGGPVCVEKQPSKKRTNMTELPLRPRKLRTVGGRTKEEMVDSQTMQRANSESLTLAYRERVKTGTNKLVVDY